MFPLEVGPALSIFLDGCEFAVAPLREKFRRQDYAMLKGLDYTLKLFGLDNDTTQSTGHLVGIYSTIQFNKFLNERLTFEQVITSIGSKYSRISMTMSSGIGRTHVTSVLWELTSDAARRARNSGWLLGEVELPARAVTELTEVEDTAEVEGIVR